MKKLLVILGIAACLQLTACGTETAETEAEGPKMFTEEAAEDIAGQYMDVLNEIVNQDAFSQFSEDSWFFLAATDWKNALVDIGTYEGISEIDSVINETDSVITIYVNGSDHDAKLVFTYDTTNNVTNHSVEIQYSDRELMVKALLNMLLGMGTTFSILILIAVIISQFSLIPKLQAKLAGKASQEEARSQSMDQAIAQIIEKEELADDSELVAVIAAAIAASQGLAATDGFRVRSIRKINTTKWKQA